MSVGYFAIPVAGSPTPPANVLREYTTGGTWSKPTDASFAGVWVFAVGAGGAGGAGGVASNVYGGSAGAGGALVRIWIPEASLGPTETYAIGAGAAGVASGNGGAGGATLFGSLVEAKGGNGGNQGSASNPAAANGGSALLCTPIASGNSISGAIGGRGSREVSQAGPGNGLAGLYAAPGGGGGGGYRDSTASGTSGQTGGGAYNAGTLTTGGTGGTFAGGNGTAGVSDIYLDPFLGLVTPTPTIGIGTGGGGGGGNSGANAAGAGAAGGRAAGGGGGGSTQTGTRGASGAGGDGFLLVYEVFAI